MEGKILEFNPAEKQREGIRTLAEAIDATITVYVAEHQRADKTTFRLAYDLTTSIFFKCISCKAEGEATKIADLKFCPHDKCPLWRVGPPLAYGVMTLIGDEEPEIGGGE